MNRLISNVIARYAAQTLSGPQKAVVDLVRNGKLRSTETGSRTGNIVALLLQKGVLGAENISLIKAEETYHGRRIPSAWALTRLFVREDNPQKPSAKVPNW